MAHINQAIFCMKVKAMFPSFFVKKDVLDVGSLDINGNNRFLFSGCEYIGMDIIRGKNVDLVMPADELPYIVNMFDTVISTEMLEHDKYWKNSLRGMAMKVRPGGLLMFTCATTGREEHGTINTTPEFSPATTDYYKNVTEEMVRGIPEWLKQFQLYKFSVDHISHDLQFWGIKDLSGYKVRPQHYLRDKFNPSLPRFLSTYSKYWFLRRLNDFKNFISL